MASDIIISSFSNGEVTPQIDTRADVAKYDSSCRRLENMLPLVYGSVTRRPGTYYVATAKNSPESIRLIPFIYSAQTAYMCEFGNLYIRFYHDQAPVLDDDDALIELVSPYLVQDLPQLQYRQIGDTMWIVHHSYPPYKLTLDSAGTFALTPIVFETGPFLTRNDIKNNDSVTMTPSAIIGDHLTVTLTASAATFTSNHIGALFAITQHRTLTQCKLVTAGTATSANTIPIEGTFNISTGGTWTGTVTFERNDASLGSTWDAWRVFTGDNDTNITEADVENDNNIYYRISAVITSGKVKAHIVTQNSDWTGIVRIHDLTSSTIANVDVISPLDNLTATLKWSEGAWSNECGYPCSVAFCEDRVVYGGSLQSPQSLWLSAVDDYENFDAGVTDADSFSVMLLTTNSIRWLNSLDSLLIGTSGDEWIIASSKLGIPITPTNFTAKSQSTFGSKDLQPVRANYSILFVDYVGRKLREETYNIPSDRYVAPDLSQMAEHITLSGIVALAYQRNPDQIVWCVRADGTIVSMTYERDQEVIGWARHWIGDLSDDWEIPPTDDFVPDVPVPTPIYRLSPCGAGDPIDTDTNLSREVGSTVVVAGVCYTVANAPDGSTSAGPVTLAGVFESCALCGYAITLPVFLLTPCVSGTSILTSTDLTANLDKIVKVGTGCYTVSFAGFGLDNDGAVTVVDVYDTCELCEATLTPIYALTPCTGGGTLYTDTDLSDYLAKVIKIGTACWEVSAAGDGYTSDGEVTVDADYDSCELCDATLASAVPCTDCTGAQPDVYVTTESACAYQPRSVPYSSYTALGGTDEAKPGGGYISGCQWTWSYPGTGPGLNAQIVRLVYDVPSDTWYTSDTVIGCPGESLSLTEVTGPLCIDGTITGTASGVGPNHMTFVFNGGA